MRCDECKHWPENGVGHRRDIDQSGSRRCRKIEPREDENSALARRAHLEGEYHYSASLWTAPDFFCALFEPKK